MSVQKICPSIQHYQWGTSDSIPKLLGIEREPGKLYAEAWYGTHPSAPSMYEDGMDINYSFSFLLKILSARHPLSIQAHPTKLRAKQEFENGNVLYADDNHKPETIVAIRGGMEARAGIRSAEIIDKIVGSLGHTSLWGYWNSGDVGQEPEFLVPLLLQLDPVKRDSLILELLVAVERKQFIDEFPQDRFWTLECARIFTPEGKRTCRDIGVVIQLLMNYVRIDEGSGLHMPAGELHAYLRGDGIEIMANSDNVLRAGLTTKPLGTSELIKMEAFRPSTPRIVRPENGEYYQEGINEYHMLVVAGGTNVEVTHTPAIALSLGSATIGSQFAKIGDAYLIDSAVNVSVDSGKVYIASGATINS